MQTLGVEWIAGQPAFDEFVDAAPMRVLLADDDDDLRQLLAATLRSDGYVVIEVADGEALIDFVASQLLGSVERPGMVDLIVSDILMPGPNGLWALATLRHLDWATPFVVITALDDDDARRQARQLGAAAFIRKPIDLKRFRAVVTNLTGPALSG